MPALPRRPARIVLLTLLVGLFVAADGSRQAAAAELEGCWNGSWRSCSSGHHGPLQATFCQVGSDRYRVTFSGRFFKILPFHYTVMLKVIADDGETITLAGSSYLGRLFGTFTYKATASATHFEARYFSRKDRGVFSLNRS